MKIAVRALLLAATALATFPALAQEEKPDLAKPAAAEKPAAPVKDYVILKVGNDDVKYSEVVEMWKSLFPNGNAPDFNKFDENIRQNVLRGLVSERLIHNEALKAGTDKDPEVQKRLEIVRKQVIMQSFMEKKAKDLVTDEQLKAAYATKVAAMKGQEEIKAKHILVATEEEAKKIYTEIKKGADFDKLAKEKSTDKGSGAHGGDLGWFTKDKMVPEFAETAFKIKKGDVSEPVKSEFGWHIIKVEDRRPVTPPTFDVMKDSLRDELSKKAMQDYVESLLKKSDVKYYGPDGKEIPFSVVLPAPAAGAPAEEKQ